MTVADRKKYESGQEPVCVIKNEDNRSDSSESSKEESDELFSG